ncbi:Homeodomain-interacting protein kinase 2 [Takifugu flavidus]|uniref:Homeodomain-interacting protein kinase 2 n=1 Tax=Takifugu flavidus TaxID=433684 RepID=A0A5C6MNB7_9TELE|nr:Homeodomain-interacting protein kinase 2 [Takifugu flavidus]
MEAVKVMKSCTDVIEIAKHEIQILKRLRRLDPNTSHVVRFNSFFFNMEDICLSFEFLDVDLDTYISEMSPCKTGLPLPEVRHITEQLVMALHHLKTIGLIHMDIKPENVMIVDRHGKPLQVKLVDFGGAQMSGNIDFETLMFTKMYSSPEVLLESEMNEALDMWSLGVTAFKLAVGTDLFPYSRRYSIINSVVQILGQPPDHVLDKGQQTEEFFNRRTNDHSRWTIKTAEEYGISEKEEDFNCFDDVVGMLSVQQEHATGLDLFMDLIKNMLQVDPNQRVTPVEALQHPFFNVKEEATSKEPCLENIQLTNYAVDQLEKPELVPPETVVSQENPAEVQPDNSGEDQLNDGFQTGDNTLNYTCFVNTLRTVGHALALPKRTANFDWFGWF